MATRQFSETDQKYMSMALSWAQRALEHDEVPIGAVLVNSGGVVSYGYNMRETWKTPLGHAEIIALQTAAKKLGRWRLSDCTLYVTLEPCVMCAGALVQARLERVVFATLDPKAGGTDSLYQICSDPRLNHRIPVESGLMAAEASTLLKDFFKKKRLEKKNSSKPTQP